MSSTVVSSSDNVAPQFPQLNSSSALIVDLDPCNSNSTLHSPNFANPELNENAPITDLPRLLPPVSLDSVSPSVALQPVLSSSPTLSSSQKNILRPLVITRTRASSWSSIFRRNSISNEQTASLAADTSSTDSLLKQAATASPISAASEHSQPTHTPRSASFSLSSLASALKRPLSLTSAPSRLSPVPSTCQSPTESKAAHELSPPAADPDPTPSVPPRLIMENASEEPAAVPFDFSLFLEQMRWPQAEPIAKYLRSFLKEFSKQANDPSKRTAVTEQVRVINDFLDFISIKMREIRGGPWDPTVCNDAEFDNAIEAMEKLVMNRVWHLTFIPSLSTPQPSQTDDLERDTVLSQKMNLFHWITDRHLDLSLPPDETDGFLEFAKTELLKINSFKAPRDKMICILNCCKVIFGLIRHINQSEGGADTFVPILILVVLRAQPEHLISNIQYIHRFRNPDKMQGENGYYLSSLNAAISFIERLEHSVLSNITQSEFEFNVEQAIDRLPKSPIEPSDAPSMASFKNNTTQDKPNSIGPSSSFPDVTRTWLFTTVPQFAEKAVSKPLNAIARIVDDLASESEEFRSGAGRNDQAGDFRLLQDRRVSSSAVDGLEQQRIQARRRGSRPWSVDSPRSIPQQLVPQDASLELSDEDLKRIDALKRAEHQAKLETLASIFPNLESEVLEVVLVTHHGQISKAIDSLLEMS
ncbi:hypothetical protein O181_017403 [Austropuccinia psidii MF-1]|uniref:VPS9 domain-containing protein n=1 Tax=Austropuccinia psidii MF-1 TaxID=1389203 RepID=A0A9Q3C721_9BASI|nr:hypothetical protein [Austropuccinia psidii MF-1]